MYFRNSGFFKLKYKDNNKEKHNLGGKLKKSQSGTTQNRMRFQCGVSADHINKESVFWFVFHTSQTSRDSQSYLSGSLVLCYLYQTL